MQLNSKNNSKFTWVKSVLYYVAGIFLLLSIWSLYVLIQQVVFSRPSIIPYPSEVIKDFFYLIFHAVDGRSLVEHVLASLFRVFYGFLYAFLIGISLGVLLATRKHLDRIIQPVLAMFRPIPPIAWIPFAIIFFGLGLASQGFVIFVGAFFPILQNTYDGIKQSSPVFRDV
ncbi:MAG: hypothetical protein E4G98_03110, partial [Promethearchaeota archaeon]